MGLFSKKNVETEETRELNVLLEVALEIDQNTGTWKVLPESITKEKYYMIVTARKMVFEYIRQLKEAGFYSNSAVQKFVKEQYSWVNKENALKFINLGHHL